MGGAGAGGGDDTSSVGGLGAGTLAAALSEAVGGCFAHRKIPMTAATKKSASAGVTGDFGLVGRPLGRAATGGFGFT
jgi:hypothetical protein